jgi:glutamate--cysteine ligase
MEHTLDVPMLFVNRDNRWLDVKGIPFRRFLAEGWKGIRPVEADWVLHLTTIFTEVRLKTYVEVRGVDGITPSLAVSFAVFWKGLLYDDISRRRAWDLLSRFSWQEHMAFNRDVAKYGPAARLGDATALDLARELLSLARESLLARPRRPPPCWPRWRNPWRPRGDARRADS